MKSQYFQKVQLTDSGKRCFKTLVMLPEAARKRIGEWIAAIESIPRNFTRPVEEISACTDSSADQVNAALSLVIDLLDDLGRYGDSVKDFIVDARVAKLLDTDSGYDALSVFLEEVAPHARRIHLLCQVQDTENRGAPLLRRANISVAIKPIFDKEFTYGETPIAQYAPEIIEYTVIAQVELSLRNSTGPVVFHLSADTLDRFISDLLAGQAELQKAKQVIEKLRPQSAK